MLNKSKHSKVTRIVTAGISLIMCGAIIIGLGGSEKMPSAVAEGSHTTPWTLTSNNPLLNKGEKYYVNVEEPKVSEIPDFVESQKISLDDYKDVVDKLTASVGVEPSDVDMYQIHEADEGLIFNPIYQESVDAGILNKYNNAYTTKGTVKLGDTTLTYEVPQNATAYDTVPIKYTLTTKNDEWLPIFVGADASEEADRVNKEDQYYDLMYPNHVEMKFEYLGYVSSNFDLSERPNINTNQSTYADSYRLARFTTVADGETEKVEMIKDFKLLTGEITGKHTLYLRNVDAAEAALRAIRLYRKDGTYTEIPCTTAWEIEAGSAKNAGNAIIGFTAETIVKIPNVDFGEEDQYISASVVVAADAGKTIDIYLDGLPDTFQEERLGTNYPNVDSAEFVASDVVETGENVWFKIKMTNVGDTVIDPEGGGHMELRSNLLKYDESTGEWKKTTQYPNHYMHIADTVYPGESQELWCNFPTNSLSKEGKYRLEFVCYTNHIGSIPAGIRSLFREGAINNQENLNQTSYFEVDVKEGAETASIKDPIFVNEEVYDQLTRNTWVHTFEEFTYAYDTWLNPIEEETYEGWLYLQIAPWTEHVTLRLINEYDDSIKVVRVPINVDTESIKINFNPNNNNYIVNEAGEREPMILTQNMTDMRTNFNYGPNADEMIAHQLLDWKECGVNVATSTNGFLYDTNGMEWWRASDAYKFSSDMMRLLGIQYIGHMTYNFVQDEFKTTQTLGEALPVTETWFDPVHELKCIVRGITLYDRWGDMYYRDSAGNMPFYMEDTRRGWKTTIGNQSIGSAGKEEFREFLVDVYGSLENVNKAWGTKYASLAEIDPEDDTQFKTTFASFTLPDRIFDIFRSLGRVESYSVILNTLKNYVDQPTMFLSQESDTFIVPGINPKTTNPTYRRILRNNLQAHALDPEILIASGTITAHNTYSAVRFSYADNYELTKRSVENGITPMWMRTYAHACTYAVNPQYGQSAIAEYNSKSNIFDIMIQNNTSVFLTFASTYEAGGVPAVLWNDEATDCVVYANAKKEMIFFKEKLDEALATKEGKAWAAKGGTSTWNPDGIEGKYSYDIKYVQKVLDKARTEHVAGGVPVM